MRTVHLFPQWDVTSGFLVGEGDLRKARKKNIWDEIWNWNFPIIKQMPEKLRHDAQYRIVLH